MEAGAMTFSLAFDAPVATPNGYGGVNASWSEEFTCLANLLFLRGGETVQAARLAGRQPVVATIHSTTAARAVGVDWRFRDLRSSETYNIRSIVPTQDRRWLEITAESGVAV